MNIGDEKHAIIEFAPLITIGTLRRILRNRWPDIGFDPDLLYRLKAKAKLQTFGNDRDAVNLFMEQGEKIRSESGIFDVRFDESLKIEEVLIQPFPMRNYALHYGDFTIVDGPFCVSMYDLTLIVFSNVDALFKTTISVHNWDRARTS